MATKKAAKKSTARKAGRTPSRSPTRRVNDPLRELLEFVVAQIEGAPQKTQDREAMQDLVEPLHLAIEDLTANPGPAQGTGH